MIRIKTPRESLLAHGNVVARIVPDIRRRALTDGWVLWDQHMIDYLESDRSFMERRDKRLFCVIAKNLSDIILLIIL